MESVLPEKRRKIQQAIEVEDELNYAIANDQLNLKSILSLWGVSSLYSNLIACGINYENMCYLEGNDFDRILGSDNHLLGEMITFRYKQRKWNADSPPKRSSTLHHNQVDVQKILHDSSEGNKIISFYDENQFLTDDFRRGVVRVILTETFAKEMVLPRSQLQNITEQICNIFQNEDKDLYYKKVRQETPTGLLYQKYCNMRHSKTSKNAKAVCDESEQNVSNCASENLNKSGGSPGECSELFETTDGVLTTSDDLITIEVDDESVDNDQHSLQTSINFLKENDFSNSDLMLQHWKNTYKYREQKLETYKNIDDAFNDWPPLKKMDGYVLLCIDFVSKYGESVACSLQLNWDEFFKKNLATIKLKITDPHTRKAIETLESSNNSESKDKTIAMALHHFLIPARASINGKIFKASIGASQDSFLKVVTGEHNIKLEVIKRNNYCKLYKIQMHPLIFEIKNKMRTAYMVGISDVLYECDTLLESIDVAYKIFTMFKIKYPPESRKVWTFVDAVFYKIGQNPMSSSSLSSIVDHLKH